MKILKGNDYTKARLAAIMHEMFVAKTDKIPPTENITMYGNGNVIEIEDERTGNKTYGLVLNEESDYFNYLPNVHKNRLQNFNKEEHPRFRNLLERKIRGEKLP